MSQIRVKALSSPTILEAIKYEFYFQSSLKYISVMPLYQVAGLLKLIFQNLNSRGKWDSQAAGQVSEVETKRGCKNCHDLQFALFTIPVAVGLASFFWSFLPPVVRLYRFEIIWNLTEREIFKHISTFFFYLPLLS